MSTRVVGRLMPTRTPDADAANESVIVKIDPATTPFGLTTGQLTPAMSRAIVAMAESDGEVGPLYDIYERMETTDTMYGGLVEQLKAAVAGFRVKVVPAVTTNERERAIAEDYAETVREAMSGLDVHSISRSFCAPHFTGAKAYFLTWEMRDYAYNRQMWMPKTVEPVRGRYMAVDKRYKSDTYGQLGVRTRGGLALTPFSNLPDSSYILLETDAARDRYHAIGAARKCLPWFLGIQYVVAWWVAYIEGFASARTIAKYPRGTGREAKAELERFLRTLGQHKYGLFPNDVELILQEANTQGTISTYGDFVRMGHSQYAISLLGQADTVGGKSEGGYARSVVANSIRFEVLQEVGAHVSKGWEALGEKTIRANYGEATERRLLPQVKPVIITPHEMTTKATTFVNLQNAGVPLPEEYPYEQVLGVEPPRVGEWVYAFGQRFRFGVDPMPMPAMAPASGEVSTRVGRDGDAEPGARSVANNSDERDD